MFRLNSNMYICNTSGKLLFLFHRVDADTEPINEPKFIVFYSMLTSSIQDALLCGHVTKSFS